MKTETELMWENYTETHHPAIKEKLIMQYFPIVKYVASRMLMTLPSSVEYNDLVSAGVDGLVAVDGIGKKTAEKIIAHLEK